MQYALVAIILLFAGLAALARKIGQPPVLGELVAGIALGTLLHLSALSQVAPLTEHSLIATLAELGMIILLFRTGLESNVRDMMRVGMRALAVACIGVALPLIGGYLVSATILGHGAHAPGMTTFLLLGAALTATSVGITARVFQDLGLTSSREARIVLGAAVIDDVLGLIILAVVSGIIGAVSAGTVLRPAVMGMLSLKLLVMAGVFIVGLVVLGQFLAPRMSALFVRIHEGDGAKMMIALFFCFAGAYGSTLVGLSPIVGAFAAGLLLDPVHFRAFPSPDIDHLIEPLAFFCVPVFFIVTGMRVDLGAFLNPTALSIALVLTVVAFAGKIASGIAAGPDTDKALVGFGMVPRGEVGLIFAAEGKRLGVIGGDLFAAIIIVIILTTLLTPIILAALVKRKRP